MIYCIFSGEYSDWNIEGYVQDEETAIQICAQSKHDLYYKCVDEMASPKKRVKVSCVHVVVFDLTYDNKWIMRNEPEHFEYRALTGSKIYDWKNGAISVEISQETNDRKRAEKIAQDMLAKFLYEHQEKGNT